MEIERKWLVPEPPPIEGLAGAPIRQGYLAIAPDGGEVRVRERGEACLLTVKQGYGLTRDEVETEVSRALFASLWPLTEGRRVEKVRTLVALPGGHTAEVDVYAGTLSGLVVAEVEFDSADAARAFTPPAWFGREVTDDRAYKNQALATDGRPDG